MSSKMWDEITYPCGRQAIIWTKAGMLLIEPPGPNFSNFFYLNSNIFIQQNAIQYAVCEVVAICVGHSVLVV